MATCYHPMLGVRSLTPNPDTGKYPVKVFKGVDYTPEFVKKYGEENIVSIPCGRCIGCRLRYSRIWADRCMAEASLYKDNIFLTLTYNDDNLPPCNKMLDGQVSPVHPLVKRDLQLFIKRLRKALPDQKIRYFACGEYSPKLRPHYHLIIFNIKLDDLQLLYRNDSQFKYYTSKTISDCWKYGFHIIADCNWHTCAYTARYIVKKQKGETSYVYEKYNYPPEFTLMSRKPGIGKEYFEQHAVDIYYGGAFLSTEDGHLRILPNKYYDSLFDIEYPDASVVLNDDKKKIMKVNDELRSNLTSMSYTSMLESEENYKISRSKALKRKEV